MKSTIATVLRVGDIALRALCGSVRVVTRADGAFDVLPGGADPACEPDVACGLSALGHYYQAGIVGFDGERAPAEVVATIDLGDMYRPASTPIDESGRPALWMWIRACKEYRNVPIWHRFHRDRAADLSGTLPAPLHSRWGCASSRSRPRPSTCGGAARSAVARVTARSSLPSSLCTHLETAHRVRRRYIDSGRGWLYIALTHMQRGTCCSSGARRCYG